MSFYNTGNPVPSIDPRDLDDNAKHIDECVNSTELTFTDRTGATRKTLAGLENSAEAVILREDLAADDGSELIGAKKPFAGAKSQTQYDINKIKISVSDFTGADPTGVALQDSVFIAAANENAGPVFVPSGVWRLSTPMILPYTAEYFGPGVLKFDNAEWWRKGGSSGSLLVNERYTLFYNYTNTADVTVTFDGVPQSITFLDDFTVLAPGSDPSVSVIINITNGTLSLGPQPEGVRAYNTFANGGTHIAPSLPSPTTTPVLGFNNASFGSRSLQNLTTGGNNTAFGSRVLTALETGENNTAVGFQALYRASGSGNTAIGSIAGEWLTTGENNSFLGLGSGGGVTTGSGNTAIGAESLAEAQAISNNTAMGYRAMGNGGGDATYQNCVAIGTFAMDFNKGSSNTGIGYRTLNGESVGGLTGGSNTSLGAFSCRFMSSGTQNVHMGVSSGLNALSSSYSVGVGFETLNAATTVGELTAVGMQALRENTGGVRNTGIGAYALTTNSVGTDNTAVGWSAQKLVTGSQNTSVGARNQEVATTGNNNTTVGFESARNLTTGSANTLFGTRAGRSLVTSNDNVALGSDALQFEATGSTNTALGRSALRLLQDGSNSTGISNSTGVGANTKVSGSNQIQLGDPATTPYAYVALQIRSDARDKIEPIQLGKLNQGKLNKILAFLRGINWVEYRNNFREDYFDEVERTRSIIEAYETPFIDARGNPVTGTREVQEVYTERVPVENDGTRAGKRFRPGAYAQEIEALCKELEMDWAGLQHHAINGGCDVYTLAYELFIPYIGAALQHVLDKQDEFESRLSALEAS